MNKRVLGAVSLNSQLSAVSLPWLIWSALKSFTSFLPGLDEVIHLVLFFFFFF